MPNGPKNKPRTPMEMIETLQSRIAAGARSYRMATVRYLMRPPLSLRPKYAAFLLDLANQSDHTAEVLGRAAERATDEQIAAVLRHHHREERNRFQLALQDLRRLGYADQLPDRQMTTGDAALRAYCTTLSYERPTAMLGVVLMILGVAGDVGSTIIRLLGVGSVPREAMRWLQVRTEEDPKALRELLQQLAELVRDPADQAAILEAAEVTGELLALGAAARPSL